MKLKIFKQIAFLLVAGVAGMGIGMAIMWNGHGASAATDSNSSESGLLSDGKYVLACEHELEKVDQVNATCGQEGCQAYYKCEKCHRNFRDADGKAEVLTLADLRIDNSPLLHDMEYVPAKTPSCTEAGCKEHWHCKNCEQKFSSEDGDGLLKNVDLGYQHNPVKHDADRADCQHAGHIAYYQCSDCEKIFADEACEHELTADAIVDEQLEHHGTMVQEKAKTHTENGYPAHFECDDCHQMFLADGVTPYDPTHLSAEYKAEGHKHERTYSVDSVVYRDFISETEAGSTQIALKEICSICGHEGVTYECSGFAIPYSGMTGVTVTYTAKTVDGKQVVDQDIYTITAVDKTIKIELPETYQDNSVIKQNGEVITPNLDAAFLKCGRKIMVLNVLLENVGDQIELQFDYNHDGVFEQTIIIKRA